jgi:hypothetical protein
MQEYLMQPKYAQIAMEYILNEPTEVIILSMTREALYHLILYAGKKESTQNSKPRIPYQKKRI